ncbi:MAG: Cu(I)/Ag(I) efflux system membrane fusion protein [Kangiellaceae bacterium]|jgi:Cu(I)/Ag(I) efflux system membrane fusion protein
MNTKTTFISALLGLLVGVLATILYFNVAKIQSNDQSGNSAHSPQPLYWVAPMDANFKRDKPGKSPMGMDLVPVYASNQQSDSPGTISINPHVINNLGVRTGKAQIMSISEPITALGFVEYNQDAMVHIHPRVEGWVESLYVKAQGDYVEKGEPLYALYSPELVNAQEEYLLALTRSNKSLVVAAKSRLSALQMPIRAINELTKTRKIQQQVMFYAPQTGFIDNLNIREGFFVTPSKTLMSIGALDEVWVNTEVMARQSNIVQLDMPVSISLEYLPHESFSGKIDYIYPTLNPSTRTLRARVRVANPNYLLKPNMYAKVTIDTTVYQAQNDLLVVPVQAVIRTGKQNRVVLALGEGKFKSVEVTLGQVFSQYIEITQGLEEFDEVVVSAQFLLDSQSSVNSDFMRLGSAQAQADVINKEMSMQMDMSQSVWTHATIIEVMRDERKLTLEHGELSEWGMPSMTMDFMVVGNIDMSALRENMKVHVEIVKTDMPMFTVNAIHVMSEIKLGADEEMLIPLDHLGHAQ